MKLPLPAHTVPINCDLGVLAPKFRIKVDRLITLMHTKHGHDAFVFETLRTTERQEFLYGFGRDYDDGRGIVTHSRDADESWHHYGLAVDIISKSKEWDAPIAFWRDLGESARSLGLHWGGDWRSFKDLPHVQWGAPMRDSPSPRAARLFAQGGFLAVWTEVGAL